MATWDALPLPPPPPPDPDLYDGPAPMEIDSEEFATVADDPVPPLPPDQQRDMNEYMDMLLRNSRGDYGPVYLGVRSAPAMESTWPGESTGGPQ